MARFTAIAALIFLVGTIIAFTAPGNLFAILQGIGFGGLVVSFFYYGWKALRWIRRLLLWKVRNRIIIAFAFVGFIPALVLALIVWFSMTFVFRQLSVVYVQDKLEQLEQELHDIGEKVVLRYYQSEDRGEVRLREMLVQERQAVLDLQPHLRNTRFRLLRRITRRDQSSYDLLWQEPPAQTDAAPELPYWVQNGFHGLAASAGRPSFRSVLPVRGQGRDYVIDLDLPMDEFLLGHIEEQTSIGLSLIELGGGGQQTMESQVAEFFQARSELTEIKWAHVLQPANWDTRVNASTVPHGALIRLHLGEFVPRYFSEGAGLGPLLPLLAGLALIFVAVEIGSLLIGIAIARSITRSIHNLYAGTRNIQEGTFDYRIPAGDRDQLEAMASAFNQMSESVVQLMSQVSDKERLEKEIEIAREVQTHLFPRELPSVSRIQLAGTCLPARRVSGDYYDFIPWSDELLDLIVADISGKGISAALLMANLQSTIRTHVAYQAARQNGERPMAEVVAAINRQMYVHTAPDKFATLVLARLDTAEMTLTYCNAGHNPPYLISSQGVRRLTQGGMVAGLFESPTYEEETLSLKRGDLLVLYTDGVVEAENREGEQFEEERLQELLQGNYFLTADDIRDLIISEVTNFMSGQEQKDDITVVTMKVG